MKTIELTQGKVAIVDDEDFERLNRFKWYAHTYNGKHWYALRHCYSNNYKQLRMHRVIMNAPGNMLVDHINGNGLDNRKTNLRLATSSQNQFNVKHPRKTNKLQIKGIRWNENLKKFDARIQANHQYIHLGVFNVLGDADSAYRKAEEKYFNEFARNNK